MSAILGRWDRTMWKGVSMQDVEDVLRNPDPSPWESRYPNPNPTIRHPVLQQPEGINLLFHHQYWAKMAVHPFLNSYQLNQLIDSMKRADLQHSTGLRFVIPFSVVDALWTHEEPTICAKSLTLLSLFEEYWKPCPGPWARVIKRAQEVGGLPSDHFAPIPSFPTDSLPTLPKLDPIRYSIETSRDVQVDRDGVLDIVTSNKMGDTSGANLFPGGYTHHPYSFGPPINVNAPPESRGVGSSGNIIDHVSGMDGMGQPTDRQERFTADDDDNHMDEDNVLGKDDSTKDLGPSNRMDTGGILGDLSGQGDDLRDNGGDGFSRHSLG
ncbi:hypothetical protein WG66_012024 [Moniliophthora roreri]|nr:hypothetical protein WG66_012024 [Moniliophthora roreri]